MQETGVQSQGQKDPLEKEMAIHSFILAWEIPQTEEPGRLQFMGLQREVAQLCPTLCNPVDHNPPGSSVPGILQARILEWVATPSSQDLLNSGIKPVSHAPCVGRRIFTTGATWEAPSRYHHPGNATDTPCHHQSLGA